jgi:hypothetical protein
MVVNTQTLIHFTENIDNLFSILEGDFYSFMSLEDYSIISDFDDRNRAGIPITCFCDIPLHLVKDHMAEYGKYGVGLSKEWGMNAGLNPVIYLKENSALQKSIYEIKEHLFYGESNIGKFTEKDRLTWELLTYIKPYNGISHKTGKPKVFYDECEWRFSPGIYNVYERTKKLPILFEDRFYKEKDLFNSILKDFPLKYKPSDIKYLIVESEDDILPIISKIEEIKALKYGPDELKILKSKIIPAQYMLDDF